MSDAKVQYKHLSGGVEFVDVIPKNPSGKIVSPFANFWNFVLD